MRKLPLAFTTLAVVACSAGGADSMASMLDDAGEMIADAGEMLRDAAGLLDDAGGSEAAAQDSDASSGTPSGEPEVLESICEKMWGDPANSPGLITRFHVFTKVDYQRLRSAWVCYDTPKPAACKGGTCSGDEPPATTCYTVGVSLSADGIVVTCPNDAPSTARLVLAPE